MATNKVKLLNPSKIKYTKTKIYIILTVSAFLSAFAAYYFIVAAQIYTPGLSGVAYGLSYTIVDLIGFNSQTEIAQWNVIIYWIIYIVANIPIIYFTLKWFSIKFLKYSVYFFVVNLFFSLIFANVPGFNIQIFGTIFSDSEILGGLGGNDPAEILMIAFIGGLIYGLSGGMVFKVGACTMGLDPLAKHLSREYDTNIGPIIFVITIVNTTVWTIIRYYTNPANDELINGVASNSQPFADFMTNTFLSATYIGSWIFAGTFTFVVSKIYPSNRKVQVFVTSLKTDQISKYWNDKSYHRGHTIYEVEGGYTHEKKRSLQMIVNSDEMYDVVEKVAAIDPKAFITVTEFLRVYDIRDWRTMTDDDIEKENKKLLREARKKEELNNKKDERVNKRLKKEVEKEIRSSENKK